MDDTTVLDTLTEIQTSNRFVLKRLNTIIQEPTTCTCGCHNEDPERELELKQLKQTIKALEERSIEKDEQQKSLIRQLNALKVTLDKHVEGRFQAQPHTYNKDRILPSKLSKSTPVNEVPQLILNDNVGNEAHETDDGNGAGQKDRTLLQDVSAGIREVLTGQCPSSENKESDDKGKAVSIEINALSGDGEINKDTIDEGKSHIKGDTERKCDDGLNTDTSKIRLLQLPPDTETNSIAKREGPVTGHVKREQSDAILPTFKDATTYPADDVYKVGRNVPDSDIIDSDNIVPHTTPDIHKEPVQEKDNTLGETNVRPVNFLKTPLKDTLGVKVVKQSEKRTLTSFMEWHMMASKEEREGKLSGLISLRGILTVVCLDISQSMAHGNAWEQTRTFFTDFIESLKYSRSTFNIDEESVALVTFGHKTEVLKRLTNDFTSLQMAFDGLSLGGPSPLYGGFLMSAAAVQASLAVAGASVNGIPVRTKFVIITDGHTTDTNLVAGPDEPTPSERDDMTAKIIEVVQTMETNFDVYVIPVGNANMEFLQLLSTTADGKLLTYRDGRKVGSRLRKTLFASGAIVGSHLQPSDSDQEDIKDILEKAGKRSKTKKSSEYYESDHPHFPQIGSRVRRGPDWQWNNQDAHGPGTVIGHAKNGEQIWVEWDNNEQSNIYRYYVTEGFDVLLTDEPRLPDAQGRLKVGCVVTPGTEWQQTTRNVNVIDKGVVIKTLENDRVQVRWPNKERGDYSYGRSGKMEVEFWPPDGPLSTGTHIYSPRLIGAEGYSTRTQEAAQSRKIPINKNKNIVHKNKNIKNKNSTNADE